jgi:hypothetical protein
MLTVVFGLFESEELVAKREPLGSVERGRNAIGFNAIDTREVVDGKKAG